MTEYRIPENIQKLHVDIQPEELKYHHRRVAVCKEFTFDAAHHLHCYEGKCKNLHGHTYRLEITISGLVNQIGMVMDFDELKDMYKSCVESKLDHKYLNEVLPPMNTTAENMIVWIWNEMDAWLKKDRYKLQKIRLEQLILYETPTSRSILQRKWMDNDES